MVEVALPPWPLEAVTVRLHNPGIGAATGGPSLRGSASGMRKCLRKKSSSFASCVESAASAIAGVGVDLQAGMVRAAAAIAMAAIKTVMAPSKNGIAERAGTSVRVARREARLIILVRVLLLFGTHREKPIRDAHG